MRWVLLVVLLVAPVAAYPAPDDAPARFGQPCGETRSVHDHIGALFHSTGTTIEREACALYRTQGVHFVLVTVAETDGEPLETYALRLFETWGIGDAERHDGVLLLYVANHGGAAALRLEVGYGVEDVLNGMVAARIVDAARHEKERWLAAGASEPEATDAAIGHASKEAIRVLLAVEGAPQGPAAAPLAAAWLMALPIAFALAGSAYLYRDTLLGRRRNEWGDTEPSQLDWFFAGVFWRRNPHLDPDPATLNGRWFRRGRRFRWLGLAVWLLLLLFTAGRSRRTRFGGGRSGGGGSSGRL